MRERLDDLLRAGELDGLHGLVVVQGGRTVLEHYGEGPDFSWATDLGVVRFGPEVLHDLRSVTKSVTALLYGVALGEGLVPAPAEPLLRHFPDYPDLAADPARARLTVEHALTMTLGFEWREDPPYDSPANAEIAMEMAADRYRFVLERPIVGPPGQRWSYCGGATALLGKLIADGTGRSLPEYAAEKLFTPLGIRRFEWLTGADGVPSAASGLRLAAPDLARIGELVLAGGRGIVPADWIATMLRPRFTTEWGPRYGYQWYVEDRFVAAMGNGGQRLVVAAGLGLVAAIVTGNYDRPDQARVPITLLEEVILTDRG
ncbi:serine hydrolase domain-containing protein [Paractinoplanes atraurantiacus]|uniref:CubicO group peptidase, beta-lactamase class C family n=1 Tax=Paractinoplanes atraurantiacus TaxID=1036182 RepID=A0A285JCK2_9ACTN|nr:CubicO group peptidase, beta-lactamase class C family [Actinoplanes atraurantiacus]